MNSIKSKTSALTLGVLALGGLMALAAPASADDYDNHGADAIVNAPYAPSGIRVVNVPWLGADNDNHGNNTIVVQESARANGRSVTVVDAATRAALDEFKRLQQ